MTRKAEKIARMVGKQTRDFRDGFATVAPLTHDSDADIKAALGMAQRRVGPLAVQVLELHYASSLQHEHAIRRAWDRYLHNNAKEQGVKRPHDAIVRSRFGAALALRKYAGARMIQQETKDFAWLLHVTYNDLESTVQDTIQWLDSMRMPAERAFLDAISDIRDRMVA